MSEVLINKQSFNTGNRNLQKYNNVLNIKLTPRYNERAKQITTK